MHIPAVALLIIRDSHDAELLLASIVSGKGRDRLQAMWWTKHLLLLKSSPAILNHLLPSVGNTVFTMQDDHIITVAQQRLLGLLRGHSF